MAKRILITGATGNVGSGVLDSLVKMRAPVKAAVRFADEAEKLKLKPDEWAQLDFLRPETFDGALDGVDKIFLMRPPALSNVKRDIAPFLYAAKKAGVAQISFLSLLGAEKNPAVPHRGIEKIMMELGVPYTFLRPSFFMQNISTTHAPEIKERDDVFVPAGHGRTSFIDARDIAEVAAKSLTQPGYENKEIPLTGNEALTYSEIAAILSEELGRPISYSNPNVFKFAAQMRKRGLVWPYIFVMLGIYTVNRFGLADTVTPDLERILGRKPTTFKEFAHDYRQVWLR